MPFRAGTVSSQLSQASCFVVGRPGTSSTSDTQSRVADLEPHISLTVSADDCCGELLTLELGRHCESASVVRPARATAVSRHQPPLVTPVRISRKDKCVALTLRICTVEGDAIITSGRSRSGAALHADRSGGKHKGEAGACDELDHPANLRPTDSNVQGSEARSARRHATFPNSMSSGRVVASGGGRRLGLAAADSIPACRPGGLTCQRCVAAAVPRPPSVT